MVYRYKRKTDRGNSWSEESMAKAVESVRRKELSIHKAAVRYDIKYSTLQKHVKINSCKKSLGRYKAVFTEHQENEFVEHIKELDRRFYGLTRKDLCELAYQYAEKNKIPHPFKNETAGEQWFANFMKRNASLSLRQPEPTSIARARGFNRPQVELFFSNLKAVVDKHKIKLDNIYNVDETGIQTSAKKPPKVISTAGKKQVGCVSSAERGTLITALFCCSATGKFIPPTLIFPRKKKNPRYLNGTPPGTLDLVTDNGWVSTDAFLKWMEFFVASVRPNEDNKCLLIMDNHSTHRCIQILDYASENNVIILTVPPHTTHKLQPLDVAVYGPFAKYFQVEIDKWQKTHPAQHVTFYEIGQIFAPAYLKAAVPNNAIKGFTKTGIADCNIDVFSDYDFLPADVTDIDNATCQDEDSTHLSSISISSTLESSSPLPSTSKIIVHENQGTDLLDSGKVRVVDIHVMPKCTKRVQRATGRKTQKSEILTSTPVKEAIRNKPANSKTVKRKIEESGQESQCEKKLSKSKIESAVPKLRYPKPPVKIDNPEENSVPCILCGDVFGNSKPGEQWIECNICAQWAHKLCADYKTGVFICDCCRESILSTVK